MILSLTANFAIYVNSFVYFESLFTETPSLPPSDIASVMQPAYSGPGVEHTNWPPGYRATSWLSIHLIMCIITSQLKIPASDWSRSDHVVCDIF